VAGFLTFNREADQYLFCYVLRPGNAPAKQASIGILDSDRTVAGSVRRSTASCMNFLANQLRVVLATAYV
jgi:hypothetical protein